ncbi:sulfite exporter TauE/SafE family protein [Candidatus Woesebacteria bacterium]|nr:MAG: sulfite exporter TauE/SafE family protein [Candidatus Woesebacteria bacterium]
MSEVITKHNEVGITKVIIGSVIYFFVQIFAAFFGGGTGILISYNLMSFFGLTILEVAATKIIPWFFLSVVSLVIFANNNFIDYKMGAVLFLGMTIGGYIGTHVAINKGDIWIKKLFYLLVAITVLKLLLF